MTAQHILKLLHPFWRLTRGMTLGAQGVVIDADGRILMVRHGYRPGWHFPGGGVEWRETLETALARELQEETGVILTGRPRLHGVFANFATSPGDHVAVYEVRHWRQPAVPPSSLEIREQRFFAPDALPEGAAPGARRRIAELFDGVPVNPLW